MFSKTISYNLKWHPLEIYLIKVSIKPIDEHTLKNVVSVLLCLEKVQVKDETGVIKKERQMAPEDVFLK